MCEEETVPAQVPNLANNQPHSTEHRCVDAELIARASHNHALFHDDNAAVYHHLEEATRSTSYVASIKPFQHAKNWREAWLAIVGGDQETRTTHSHMSVEGSIQLFS